MMVRPDIIIDSLEKGPIAVVEVKNSLYMAPSLAAELRHQLHEYGLRVQAPYFLIVSQDSGYLWREETDPLERTLPTWVFPMRQVVAHYVPALDAEARLREPELELIIRQWLDDVAGVHQVIDADLNKALAGSGFLEAIQGATISVEPKWLASI